MNAAIEALRRDFGGDVVEPGAAEYAAASRTMLVTGSPAVVLRPANVGDVQAAVRFAAEAGLVLSVRGGGHAFPGFGTNDGGVVFAPYVDGAYAGFLSSATEEDVAAVYPVRTYRRLAAVKRRWDPGNLFAGNYNVRPA